jgi:hypothetical protein
LRPAATSRTAGADAAGRRAPWRASKPSRVRRRSARRPGPSQRAADLNSTPRRGRLQVRQRAERTAGCARWRNRAARRWTRWARRAWCGRGGRGPGTQPA